jgi:hypothetical protein
LGSKFRGSPFLACGFNASEVFSCQPHQCCWDLAARAKGGVRRSIQRKAAGCSNVRGCGGSCSKEKLATYPSATNRVCKVWSALFWCPNPTAFFWGCYLCDRGPPAEPSGPIQAFKKQTGVKFCGVNPQEVSMAWSTVVRGC